MFHSIGGIPGEGGDDLFYDADDGQSDAIPMRLRTYTDFPEYERHNEPVESMGPWRTTEVERHNSFTSGSSSSWLLVGRRHSVDDRRDALEQGKTLFLHSLAEKADGLWRTSTATRAEQMQQAEEQAENKLTAQAQSLKAASDFWAERHTSDKAYLERLEACANASSGASALPPQQAQAEAEWRLNMQSKAEYSGSWAKKLPDLIESHEKSAAEIRRAIVRAIADADSASKLVRDARASVWPPKPVRAPTKFLGSQGADFGPGPCLWLAVRRYLMACGGLHRAQSTALARVKREEERLALLGSWVDRALGHTDGGSGLTSPVHSHGGSVSSHSSAGLSTASSVPEVSPERTHKAERDPAQESESGEESEEEVLDISMDVSALVVFEQGCDVRRTSDESWASSHLVFSVDLWLHIWTPSDNYRTTTPADSISLTGACLRPVAERCKEDPRVLQLRFRPPAVPTGVVKSIGSMIWGKSGDQQRELWIRCADDEEADELLASLELVEKLYPIVT
mmetsp:Transcript_78057/g.135358  ORF Transcript_78057/g.135358 Transcript_78057/m.135358 type:complete len:511 (+) Transcript_78057:88-1620(+)